ncbi:MULTISPECIES: hypothetical protein [unclassified Bradyrhizobium]|uniref:hypothetical protein n=1 Tax=unclassified Bradyrhizobium TaxID=2631580 RepID=UPI0028E5225C|nr:MULTISPECIES: hypothetical protein [unclassified Bradyrhizobium]
MPGETSNTWSAACVCVTDDDLRYWQRVGKDWARSYPKVPLEVQQLWVELWKKHKDAPVFKEPEAEKPAPEWWKICWSLMAIADEACESVGYIHVDGHPNEWKGSWVALMVDYLLRNAADGINPSDRHRRVDRQIASICLMADRDVVCVQPKSHTPEVGCTPRTLAHNLALLPPRGEMRAHWQRPPQHMLPEARTDLRLLLIPYPFEIEANWFTAEKVTTEEELKKSRRAKPWGWFEIEQGWLPRNAQYIVQFVDRLLQQARASAGSVNGVVFPEYALDWKSYKAIADHLRDNHPGVEFFVAGTSDNCAGEKGNFALSSHFFDELHEENPTRMAATTSRAKHHRWRLDHHQLVSYDLVQALEPDYLWWEKIVLQQREIHIKVIRSSSVFTTMICEDLARSDPCHEVLRAIGPNLVFVLLMDGPQLPIRWSARYATALSDDPGSSVLTFTSRALIARSNAVLERLSADERGARSASWAVGLWKDATGSARVIECPPGAHGVIINLLGDALYEATLDARQNGEASRWKMVGAPITVSLDAVRDKKLLDELGFK